MGLSGVLSQPAGVMADCRFWRLYLAGTASSSSFTIIAGKKGSFRRLSAIGIVGQPCILTDFFLPSPETESYFQEYTPHPYCFDFSA